MSEHDTTRRRFVGIAGGAAIVSIAGCTSGGGDAESTAMDDGTGTAGGGAMTDDSMDDSMEGGPTTFTVRIENVAPTDFYGSDTATGGGIWLTPGAYAVHTGSNPIHTPGESASVGLEALAEAGPPTGFPDRPGLVGELRGMEGGANVVSAGAYTPENTVADPNDPTGAVPGAPPIAPGGAFEFEVESEPGERLSFASMFVPSNDIFVGPGAEGIPLWADGTPVNGDVTDAVDLWDAGTEPNAEPPGQGPDQAPAQERPDQGTDENGVVRRVDAVDDGHDYPAVSDVVRVTVRPSMDSMDDDTTSGDDSMSDGSMNDDTTSGDDSMSDDSMNNDTMSGDGG